MARRKTAIRRRTSPSRTGTSWKSRLANVQRKKSQEKKQRLSDMSAVAGGALLGGIDRWGFENPIDIPGVDDAAVYALLAYILGDRFLTGKLGDIARGMGVGMMSCAARDAVNGPNN